MGLRSKDVGGLRRVAAEMTLLTGWVFALHGNDGSALLQHQEGSALAQRRTWAWAVDASAKALFGEAPVGISWLHGFESVGGRIGEPMSPWRVLQCLGARDPNWREHKAVGAVCDKQARRG